MPLIIIDLQGGRSNYGMGIQSLKFDIYCYSKSSSSQTIALYDKVYENLSRKNPYSENDLLGGSDPYSSSKAAVELAVKAWRKSFLKDNIKVSTARAGNVIGGGDWAKDRIVPDTIRALTKNHSLYYNQNINDLCLASKTKKLNLSNVIYRRLNYIHCLYQFLVCNYQSFWP